MSFISIIIPVYNRKDALRETLQSLMQQNYDALEIIVVDDGSREDIETLVTEMTRLCPFSLQYIRQDNQGAPAARNHGFRISQGDYVLFLDADVRVEPDMLRRMVQVLDTHLEVSYAYCHFYFGQKKMYAHAFDADALRKRNYISTMSVIRRDDFPGFDEALTRFQDWDLWLTMLDQGKKGILIDAFLFQAAPHEHGMSTWLPSFAYRKPWRYLPWWKKQVDAYHAAKKVIIDKHALG